jgi:KaiC/GvpD/RAD55 family RecA-like ATPase
LTDERPAARELYLAAQFLARPDLWEVIGGAHIIPKLTNQTAKAVLKVLDIEGPTFAAPGAMRSAVADSEYEVNPEELYYIFESIPDKSDVSVGAVETSLGSVLSAARERTFAAALRSAASRLGSGYITTSDARLQLQQTLDDFDRSSTKKPATAESILGQLASKELIPKTRWKSGNREFDEIFNGVDRDGNPATGMLAQKEVVIVTAAPGVGKTREALAWIPNLLSQGASVAVYASEDDAFTFATRIMASQSGVPRWKVEQFLVVERERLTWKEDSSTIQSCTAVQNWFVSLGDRLRIYDTEHLNIFDFAQVYESIVADKALYGTTHTIYDYVQAFRGAADPEKADDYAFRCRELAARYNLCLILLSQQSGQDLRYGAPSGILKTKGSTSWGQIAHLGIEIERDEEIGDAEFKLTLQKARDGGRRSSYVKYDLASGRVKGYAGTGDHWLIDGPKKGRRK